MHPGEVVFGIWFLIAVFSVIFFWKQAMWMGSSPVNESWGSYYWERVRFWLFNVFVGVFGLAVFHFGKG